MLQSFDDGRSFGAPAVFYDCGIPVKATLTYRQEDPYAVAVTMHTRAGDEEWRLSRDQLADGCQRPVGDLNVRIAPGGEDAPGQTEVTLTGLSDTDSDSPPRFCTIRLLTDTATLHDFVHDTYEHVPAGREHEHLNTDAELAREFPMPHDDNEGMAGPDVTSASATGWDDLLDDRDEIADYSATDDGETADDGEGDCR